MATEVVTTLKVLQCFNSKSGHSRPYIWSALLSFDSQGLRIARPGPETVQVVLKEDMRPGETADIPASVGVLSAQIDGGFLGMALVVLLLQKEETRVDAMRAGFESFFSELGPAVTDNNNLADLAGDDTRQAAIDRIKARVQEKIAKAIHDHMGTADKLLRPHDSLIDSNFQFLDLRSQFFSVLFSTGAGEYSVSAVLDTGSWAARPVVSWGRNRLDVFGLGVNNDMFHKWWDGTKWGPPATDDSAWQWLGGTFNSPPAVVAWGPNRLDVFGLGVSNDMFHKWWDGTKWGPPATDDSAWQWLGGTFNSPPAVVSWGPNRLDVFGLGVNNELLHKWWDGAKWGPSETDWEGFGDTITFNSPPAAVSWGPNRLDIFGVGADSSSDRGAATNTMFHKWWDGAIWGPSRTLWQWLGGTFNSPPAVVSWGPNRIDVFGLGVHNDMFHKWWDGTKWGPPATDDSAWQWLGGTFNSPPAVVSWGPNRLDVFGLGGNNEMLHKWWDGTSWGPSQTGWESLGGTFNSPPAVVSWSPNRLDVFGLGGNNEMLHKWWDGASWGPSQTGWQPLGGIFNRL